MSLHWYLQAISGDIKWVLSMGEKSLDHFTAVHTAFKHFSNENGIQNEQSTFNAKITAVYFSKPHLKNVFLIYEPYICNHMIIEHVSGNIKQSLTWLTSSWSINMSKN